jgi:DNA recombination protein RmuC
MNEWLIEQGVANPQTGWLLGLLLGLLITVVFAWGASRRAAMAERKRLQPLVDELESSLSQARAALAESERRLAVLETRSAGREEHYREQLRKLEDAEKRLAEVFERQAVRIFEQRSEKLSDLNQKQIETLLKPLGEKLTEFRDTVNETHKQDSAQHQLLQAKLKDLQQLNVRLHDDATHLTQALTSNVKAQGNWGEQQLERLLELTGLVKGREYFTQYSVTTPSGQRVQPDLVLQLPEGKSIVMDSKVSLTAWTRLQSCDEEEERSAAMKAHVQSLRQHITGLGEKRYADIEELDALDFVLMFVPIEASLIAALQADPELPEFALANKVALLSPTNFLATMRAVSSVWQVDRQNRNAREIASRAGKLYDKFAGFVDNLQQVGDRLRQAQHSYDTAFSQLSTGAGNLVRQADMLRELGARHSKQLDARLSEAAEEEEGKHLQAVPAEPALKKPDSKKSQP